MKATLTLDESEIKRAIEAGVVRLGWRCSKVTLSHFPGDQREPGYYSAAVEVEPAAPAPAEGG